MRTRWVTGMSGLQDRKWAPITRAADPMSFTDAVSRISQIQAQIASVQSAFDASAASGASQSESAAQAPSSSTYASNGSTTFADALAQAQSPSDSAPDSELGSSQASALPASSLATTLPASSLATTLPATSLPASAQSMLTTAQQQFAARLATDTGLDPGVITSWLLAEESGGAAQSRQGANNNDWLNIGYTDSATYGSSDSIWSDPSAAADATAGWLKGHNTIPGYGTASSGIQAIPATAGQSPATQIAAIQQSGWASSGYPDLPGLYQQVAA